MTNPLDAHASAFGCKNIGGFGFDFKGASLKAPKGFLCHYIIGDGKVIKEEQASYSAHATIYGALTGRVCNFRIDWKYYNTNNSLYRTDRGATNNSCSYTVRRITTADKTLANYGRACAVMYVNGVERSRQCHYITR